MRGSGITPLRWGGMAVMGRDGDIAQDIWIHVAIPVACGGDAGAGGGVYAAGAGAAGAEQRVYGRGDSEGAD